MVSARISKPLTTLLRLVAPPLEYSKYLGRLYSTVWVQYRRCTERVQDPGWPRKYSFSDLTCIVLCVRYINRRSRLSGCRPPSIVTLCTKPPTRASSPLGIRPLSFPPPHTQTRTTVAVEVSVPWDGSRCPPLFPHPSSLFAWCPLSTRFPHCTSHILASLTHPILRRDPGPRSCETRYGRGLVFVGTAVQVHQH